MAGYPHLFIWIARGTEEQRVHVYQIKIVTFLYCDLMIHAVSIIFHEMKPIHFSQLLITHYLNNNHSNAPNFQLHEISLAP